MTTPIVAAIDMGYGHLRPASALAAQLGTEVLHMELPPLGAEVDRRFWEWTREVYEPLTRFSQLPGLGPPMRALLNTITAIPEPWPARDLSESTQGTRWMERAARDGVGRALAEHLKASGAPLLTTFYAAAILAELHGATRLHCLITDSDINRVWAPPDAPRSEIRYFAPTDRARRRMESYGVRPQRIRVTGYPLPHELVGGRERPVLKQNLAARLARIDRRGEFRRQLGVEAAASEEKQAPLIVFAVGGAGAQVPLAKKIVQGMRKEIDRGSLRLALVAGRRPEVGRALREALYAAGLDGHPGAEVHEASDFEGYLRGFNQLLARADAIWSKPSEIAFFAALGLPLISAPPVGVHEKWNLRWATDRGAGLPQHDPLAAGEWLTEWIEDGALAGAAWAGYTRLPQFGLYEIIDELTGETPPARR
jgi:hypothetical protein